MERIKILIRGFLKELQGRGASRYTLINYEKHLGKFVEFLEENSISFSDINGKQSKAFRNYLLEKGLSPRSINTILSCIKSFYYFLVDEGEIKGNPIILRNIKVKEEEKKPDFLTEDELNRLKKYLKKVPEHINLLFNTMLATGLRVGEVAELTNEDVIIDKGRLLIRVRSGKGKKERYVPVMDDDVAREILTLSKKRGKLFKVSRSTIIWWAWKIKKDTGIDFHSHRLRHTVATNLLSKGYSLDVIQKVLGHTSILTTRRYAETLPDEIRKLAVKVK